MKNKLAIRRMAIFIFTLVMCISIFQLRNKSVQATTLGGKWNSTIKYYFSDSDKQKYPAYYQRFKTCALIWTSELQMMNSNVQIVEISNSSYANVTVSFQSLGGQTGWSNVYPNSSSGIYTSGTIIFSPYKLVLYNDNEITSIMLHEIGHVLGLAHAPNGTVSVMVEEPVGPNTQTWPTSYDIQDLRSLYYR